MKLRSLRPVFIAIALGGSVFTAFHCSHETIIDIDHEQSGIASDVSKNPAGQFRVLNKAYTLPVGKLAWQAQLDKIIEDNASLKENDLELIGYQHIADIQTIQDLREAKDKVGNLYPQYTDTRTFTIIEDNDFKKNFRPYLDSILPEVKNEAYLASLSNVKKEAVYTFEGKDLGVVDLTWKHKGRLMHTRCFVSDKKGIVFDNLLYFIVYQPADQISAKAVTKWNFPRLLTLSDDGESGPSPNCLANSAPSYLFNPSDQAYNVYGIRVYYWEIKASVPGECVDGKKSIIGKTVEANYDSSWGFSCIAQVATRDFKLGLAGYLDFAYGWAWSRVFSVSLEWNGAKFSVSGSGATGSVGEIYVSPSMLN